MLKVSIAGGSGYTGGEALRLLLGHPYLEVGQITSESNAGKLVHHTHPNLRGVTKLKFCSITDLDPADILILGLPHGESQKRIDDLLKLAPQVCDLAADFRLHSPDLYREYYGEDHARPDLLNDFVYAVPEVHREAISKATLLSGAGCIATSIVIALRPLFDAGVVAESRVMVDAKVGSSAAGASGNPATHHPERAGALRSFKPTGHRHTAEIVENLSTENSTKPEVYLTATSTPAVRGILSTAQLFVNRELSDLDIRSIYRERYGAEPFVRIVKERRGVFRYPEPKLLSGTNFIDIGFELEPKTNRLVVMSAIDNLVKGSAGNVIQSLNLINGWDEKAGLEFPGLHPI